MNINERPGVYSTIKVESSIGSGYIGKVIGIAGVSASGEKGKSCRILSYDDAVDKFGEDCSLTKHIKILLLNGATRIVAVPVCVGGAATKDDYKQAFKALIAEREVSIMVCDSSDAEILNEMRTAILGASESGKYRIGICDMSGKISEVCEKAEAINCERMVMAYPSV